MQFLFGGGKQKPGALREGVRRAFAATGWRGVNRINRYGSQPLAGFEEKDLRELGDFSCFCGRRPAAVLSSMRISG
jgi:hypothetical protein